MLNNFDKLTLQMRILIATALSMLFFIPYSYFFTPSPKESVKPQQLERHAPQTSSISSVSEEPQNASTNDSSHSSDYLSVVHGKHFRIEIDSFGRIAQAYLKDAKFLRKEKELPLFSSLSSLRPLELRFADESVNKQAFAVKYQANRTEIEIGEQPESLILTQQLNGFVLTKKITFYPDGHYDIEVDTGGVEKRFFLTPGSRPVVENDRFVFNGAVLKESDGTIYTVEDGDATKEEVFAGAPFVASADRYYTTLFFTREAQGLRVVITKGEEQNPAPFVEISGSAKLSGYIGAKDFRLLQRIYPPLTDVVEYGLITFFAKPLFTLLDWLYHYCGNWGWAIVMLTIIVRIILFPLTYKGMVSMQKLKDIAPKMKEIQERYKGDPQKLQLHMMELYKKHGANPMGGCLPLLLQIPIFFAIYRVLYSAIELKGAEWALWIIDLSAMDPYFILPILMGASMFLQQHLTPTTFTDPMQEKVFKFLPLIFTFFFITFPSGLVLYWFVSNVFSIAQQLYINKRLEAQKLAAQHKAS
ncbi:MAG: membrane protein insertase YidC [Wolinella sp.]